MPPQSLSVAPLPSPQPVLPALASDGAWEKARPQSIFAHPRKVCPDCQPHTDLPQGSGDPVICPRLCPYELIFCLPLTWGFRTSCQMGSRKEAPDWLVEERAGLGSGLNSNLAPQGLLRPSFKGREGLRLVFKHF